VQHTQDVRLSFVRLVPEPVGGVHSTKTGSRPGLHGEGRWVDWRSIGLEDQEGEVRHKLSATACHHVPIAHLIHEDE
jgi:hypothetical protein